MYGSVTRGGNQVLRPFHMVVALVTLTVPLVSAILLVSGFVLPAAFGFAVFTQVVLPLVFGLNVANILLFLGVWRARVGPPSLINVWSVSVVFSGGCASTALVLAAFFAVLGASG